MQLPEQLHYLVTASRVESSGRFIGKKQRRPVDQRTGYRHPLLLAAAQLRRVAVRELRDAQLGEQLPARRLGADAAFQLGRDEDVLQDRQVGEQVEELEHEPDVVASKAGQGGLAQRSKVGARNGDAARCRPIKACDKVEERGLAAARGSHHGCELALLDGQRHPVEGTGHTALVDLGDFGEANQLAHSDSPEMAVSDSSSIHLMSASV